MAKYRKKPVVIDAFQYTGNNTGEARKFVGDAFEVTVTETGIQTLEGFMRVNVGVYGEFYPCNPDIFKATYEKVDNSI